MTQQHRRSRSATLIGAGLLTLALLVVPAMGLTTPAARADGSALATRSGAVAVRPPSPAPTAPIGRLLGPGCPAGTVLIMWEKPVYDADGLFVVDWELVPYCIPEDLEPAG
ncbi:MAG: hypothetical protein AB7R89_33215 [Dehalococcoidia bacterium]